MKRILLLIPFVFFTVTILAQLPHTFMIDPQRLVEIKKRVDQKDKLVLQWIDSLEKEANGLLNRKPVSVMDKAVIPVSGNKHDYMSQAPYFWYDSSKVNGLPYMRKDGVRNPEIYKLLTELTWAILIMPPGYYRWPGILPAKKNMPIRRLSCY